MPSTYLISDLHVGHSKIITFKRKDGELLRPFSSIEEMHSKIRDSWNSVVKKHDTVIVLGDVMFGAKWIPFFKTLTGQKRLIRGNHDSLGHGTYTQVFGTVHALMEKSGAILTHIPLHPNCLGGRNRRINIHGHLHDWNIDDPRYVNVSCEMLDYKPINFEEILDAKRHYIECE